MPYFVEQETSPITTCLAGSDFTGDVGKLVEITVAETSSNPPTVDICNAITDKAYGVIVSEGTAGTAVRIRRIGKYNRCISGGAITLNAAVAPTAAGKFQVAVSTQFPVGIALSTTSGADEYVIVELQPVTLTPLA